MAAQVVIEMREHRQEQQFWALCEVQPPGWRNAARELHAQAPQKVKDRIAQARAHPAGKDVPWPLGS